MRHPYKALKEALRCFQNAWVDWDKMATNLPKPVDYQKHYDNHFKARLTQDPSVDKHINEEEISDD